MTKNNYISLMVFGWVRHSLMLIFFPLGSFSLYVFLMKRFLFNAIGKICWKGTTAYALWSAGKQCGLHAKHEYIP